MNDNYTIEYMRKKISKVYPGMKWVNKCRAMHPDQVYAIYHKFKEEGRFDKKKNKQKEEYYQYNIFDYIK